MADEAGRRADGSGNDASLSSIQPSLSSLSLAAAAGAKPFVPGGGGGGGSFSASMQPAASLTAAAVNAAPFVPGSISTAATAATTLTSDISAAAAPFVPRSALQSVEVEGGGAGAVSSSALPDDDDLLGSMTASGAAASAGGAAATGGSLYPQQQQHLHAAPLPSVVAAAAAAAATAAAAAAACTSVYRPGAGFARAASSAAAAAASSGGGGGGGGIAGLASALIRARESAARSALEIRALAESHAATALAQATDQAGIRGMPVSVGPYHSLYPLEEISAGGHHHAHHFSSSHPSSAAAASAAGSGFGAHAAASGGFSASGRPLRGGERPHHSSLGVLSMLVKGVSDDGGAGSGSTAVALRRLDPRRAPPSAELVSRAVAAVRDWSPLAGQPNICVPLHTFVSSEDITGGGGAGAGEGGGGAPALWFAHELLPGASTAEELHVRGKSAGGSSSPSAGAAFAGLIPPIAPSEDALWSYLVQLTCALRAAHTAGLELRPGCLHPSKILICPGGRLRVGAVGIPPTLAPGEAAAAAAAGGGPAPEALAASQRADLAAVGRLCLTLACHGGGLGATPQGGATLSVEACAARSSPEFAAIVTALLNADPNPNHVFIPPLSPRAPAAITTWHALAAALGGRLLSELDLGALRADALAEQLRVETGHGRMLRTLSRLSAVTERPPSEDDGVRDRRWCESGDCYVLSLFRDYVFHQSAADGSPLLDWGHVAECLAKLDAGVPEKVLLLSRDGASMLVVTFADVRRCIEGAWRDLGTRARAAQQQQRQQQAAMMAAAAAAARGM